MTQINWQYQVNNRAGGYIVTNTDWNDVAGDLRAFIDQTTSSTTDNTPLPIGIDLVNDRVYISDPDSTTPEDANHADTTLSVVGTTTLNGNTQQTGDLTVGVDGTGHDVKLFGTTSGVYSLWDQSADEWTFVGADLDMDDNAVIRIGTGDDLLVYANGSHSFIDHDGDGELYIRARGGDEDMYVQAGDNLFFQTNGANTRLTINQTGAATFSGDLVPSSALSNRNVVLNPDMKINQREGGASGGPNGGYVLDQWGLSASGGTRNYNVGAFTLGSPAASGYASPNYASFVLSSMSTVGGYAIAYQKIEDVRTLAGETVVISFYAKAASGTPVISTEIQQDFGSGGSPSADVNTDFGRVTLSTSWARYSVTATIPSVSSKTLGTTANTSSLTLNLWLSSGSTYNARNGSMGAQNNTFDIWGVQIERGSNATPLEVRSHAEELARCQRYYQRTTSTGGDQAFASGVFLSSTQPLCALTFPPMRAAPTVTFHGSSGTYDAVGNAAAYSATSLVGQNITLSTMQIGGTVSGATGGQGCVLRQDSGYFEMSAEL